MSLNYTPKRKVLRSGQIDKIRNQTLNHNPVIARVKLQLVYGDKLKHVKNGDVTGLEIEVINMFKDNTVLDVQRLSMYDNPLQVALMKYVRLYGTGSNNCSASNTRSMVCPLASIDCVRQALHNLLQDLCKSTGRRLTWISDDEEAQLHDSLIVQYCFGSDQSLILLNGECYMHLRRELSHKFPTVTFDNDDDGYRWIVEPSEADSCIRWFADLNIITEQITETD